VQLRTFFQVNVYVKTRTCVTAMKTPVMSVHRNVISHTAAYGDNSTAEKLKNTRRTGNHATPDV
jgi:hypothetical protein